MGTPGTGLGKLPTQERGSLGQVLGSSHQWARREQERAAVSTSWWGRAGTRMQAGQAQGVPRKQRNGSHGSLGCVQGSREGKASTVAGSEYGGEGVLGRGGPISFSRKESFGFQRFLWQQCIKHDLRLMGGMAKALTRSGDSGKGNTARAWEHYGG